jgi:hypothetical protein
MLRATFFIMPVLMSAWPTSQSRIGDELQGVGAGRLDIHDRGDELRNVVRWVVFSCCTHAMTNLRLPKTPEAAILASQPRGNPGNVA